MFNDISTKLAGSRAAASRLAPHQAKAAILMPLMDRADPRLLLTVRAEHLSSHPGEVAFPGGKVEPTDSSLLTTALRETHEEVGIHEQQIHVLGHLPNQTSRFGVSVKPFVGLVDEAAIIKPCPDELASTFAVPMSFFRDTQPYEETRFKGAVFPLPSYEYDGHIIWGLTARFIIALVEVVFEEGTQGNT